jgi:hypothetical protein
MLPLTQYVSTMRTALSLNAIMYVLCRGVMITVVVLTVTEAGGGYTTVTDWAPAAGISDELNSPMISNLIKRLSESRYLLDSLLMLMAPAQT